MKIKITKNETNLALLQSLGSKNRQEVMDAHESLAEFIGPILQEVINNAPTLSTLFENLPFNENSSPSIPLDTYVDVLDEDYLRVWSQSEPGGLPTNMPTPPTQELKFMTYPLESAIAFHQKYAREGRLDVLAKSMERLSQEIMLKQERNAAGVLLRALAQATSNTRDSNSDLQETSHIIRTTNADQFLLHDFNRLFTLLKRINSSWNHGTPDPRQARGLTDIIVSPEVVQSLREMAYNPINTRAGATAEAGTPSNEYAGVTGIPATDQMRQQIHQTAGIPEFFGVNIMEIQELGIGYKYNDLFDFFAGSTNYPGHEGDSESAFDASTEEIIIGLDLAKTSLIRPVAQDSDTGSEFTVEPDDQFVRRSGKLGFFGRLEEGRLILNDKVLSGLIL